MGLGVTLSLCYYNPTDQLSSLALSKQAPAMAAPHTSHSLLERARDPTDAASWRRLTDLYTPLIRRWARTYVAQAADADDVVQDVLAVLVRELPHFEHSDNPGAFRAWLRSITVNR